MKHISRFTPIMLLALTVLLSSACRDKIIPETPDYVEYGWELMADSTYQAAIEQFQAGVDLDPTYADGWNGLGWAYSKLGDAVPSAEQFTTAINKQDTSIVATEAWAGRSFAKLALGEFITTVSDAKEALALTPDWIFRRNPTITSDHVTLTAATAFYGLAEYDSCLVWIMKLDITFFTNVNTLAGRSRLAVRLESLKSEI